MFDSDRFSPIPEIICRSASVVPRPIAASQPLNLRTPVRGSISARIAVMLCTLRLLSRSMLGPCNCARAWRRLKTPGAASDQLLGGGREGRELFDVAHVVLDDHRSL